MTRGIDFGHDRDIAAARVLHDLPVLFLGVITTSVAANLSTAADLRQSGPGFDLDAPALVIAEVKVQAVDLVLRDQVDKALYLLQAEEMSCHVEHRAAPGKAGDVAYR